MQNTTLTFPYPLRTTFSAIKNFFSKQSDFSLIKANEELFCITARHGAWYSPFSENIKIKVTATTPQSSKVVVESSSRSILNALNFGANQENILNLSDYIDNEVYRIVSAGEIPTSPTIQHSEVKIVAPEIKIKK